jgi:hypothetical protein
LSLGLGGVLFETHSRTRKIFPHACVREIPYDGGEKDGDWIRVNAKHGMWVGFFGSGFIEKKA